MKWMDTLADECYSREIVALIIDECHNIIDWDDFHPHYRELSTLKAIVASTKPWGLFTATCDEILRGAILKSLNLQTIVTIAVTPNRYLLQQIFNLYNKNSRKIWNKLCCYFIRANIFLDAVFEKAMKVPDYFKSLATDLKALKLEAPKTIIYCR